MLHVKGTGGSTLLRLVEKLVIRLDGASSQKITVRYSHPVHPAELRICRSSQMTILIC
jgi:hypothetical protein